MSFPETPSMLSTQLREPRALAVVTCRRNLTLQKPISDYARAATVVIGIPFKNSAQTLRRSIESALTQELAEGHCAIVILDDQSSDAWMNDVGDLLAHRAMVHVTGHCGSPAQARNAVLDFIETELPQARWIARLDADDCFSSAGAVEALRSEGENKDALFVVGSNDLVSSGEVQDSPNIANPDVLLNPSRLVEFIHAFCSGQSRHELPSCNLLLRSGSGIRYPLLRSAEDHWLVAQLLVFKRARAAIVPTPLYCRYTLKGSATSANTRSGAHKKTRAKLVEASRAWLSMLDSGMDMLGHGMEGCVARNGSQVVKQFYSWSMTPREIAWIASAAKRSSGRVPEFFWEETSSGTIRCVSAWQDLKPVGRYIPRDELLQFLVDVREAGFSPRNIKRDNLMLDGGRLVYIDIGRDIVPFKPAFLVDIAARLFSIGVLGLPDGELTRRQSFLKAHEAFAQLAGFEEFYLELIRLLHSDMSCPDEDVIALPCMNDVTLMIKACPQDHAVLSEQVPHIVTQLSRPKRFAKVVLAIDPHQGNYLRQFSEGDLTSLLEQAERLRAAGTVGEVWVAPEHEECIQVIYQSWFGLSGIARSHTLTGAPLYPQLWAFEQVGTRYVLQSDVDVLIGRKDPEHDFMVEMLAAMEDERTWCVGFNIPKSAPGFYPYMTRPQGFAPEIRLGLLDLAKIKSSLPLPNEVSEGHLVKMWHRSMELAQHQNGMRSVRGGDDRSFYVHPMNDIKATADMELIRDLIGQGCYPPAQAEQWDLVSNAHWRYLSRSEDIVFLMKGRNTPVWKLRRALASLRQQSDQDFGVILIDDASECASSWKLPDLLMDLTEKTTLIRRRNHAGYIPNFLLAASLCNKPETMICVLDQDDALMSRDVVVQLKTARAQGADLINGLMFRPSKPTRFYHADYDAPRQKGGGNTWTHLRAFTKALFDRVPAEEYKVDGEWIADVSDYATMLPMAELATAPVHLEDQYYVWHEREDYSEERKRTQARLISLLLSRSPLQKAGAGSAAAGTT